MTPIPPSLSVIVAVTGPLGAALACLADLARACQRRPAEIIVAHGADAEVPPELRARQPEVTLVAAPTPTTLPTLLGRAIHQATGDVIAITDGSCGIDPDWLSAIMKAHESPHPVIGGAVEPDGLRGVVDWAAYFCDYGAFMRPLTAGTARHVPGINISVKRWALTRGREFVDGEFWKGHWCRRLQTEGFALYLAPAIVVYYRKSFRLRLLLSQRFHHGRCFAAMRAAELTRVQHAMYATASPVLPILFCTRILRAVLPKGRHVGELCAAFPVIALATTAWALGELCGYALGAGSSCRQVR